MTFTITIMILIMIMIMILTVLIIIIIITLIIATMVMTVLPDGSAPCRNFIEANTSGSSESRYINVDQNISFVCTLLLPLARNVPKSRFAGYEHVSSLWKNPADL